MALPVAVAGSVVAEDIAAAAPTGACAPTEAAPDLLAEEVITGAEVFAADRQAARAGRGSIRRLRFLARHERAKPRISASGSATVHSAVVLRQSFVRQSLIEFPFRNQ